MELSFLQHLYDTPGTWTSVYLDASHDTTEARAATRIRWKDLREQLRERGVDESTVDALGRELVNENTYRPLDQASFESHPHRGRHGVALFATAGEVRYAELLESPPEAELVDVSPLPRATPLLAGRGEQVPWLRVVCDRTGADIGGSTDTIQVQGTNLSPIRKSHGGGWSQEHLHRKAELRWHHNAKQVAPEVARTAEALGAEILIVAGDVRARQLLIEELPERWRSRVVEVQGGSRAPGADPGPVDEVTRLAVAEQVAERRAGTLDRFRSRDGELAAVGLPAVVAALERAQVDTLLLDPGALDDTPLWIEPAGPGVATDAESLRLWGAPFAEPVRAEDALIRAAAATDADALIITPDEGPIEGGVGAVLRYADAATPHR